MKKVIVIAFLSLIGLKSNAQETKPEKLIESNSSSLNNQYDLSAGIAKNEFIGSLSYRHIWGLGKRKQWRIGGGLRFSSYQGSGVDYLSAPPDYAGKEELTDTVTVSKAQQNNVALLLTVTYRIKNKFEFGFNVDLVGYSFGAKKNAVLKSNGIFTPTSVSANSPTALLVGANDVGMIRSEFMVGYWLTNNFMLRLGVTSLNTEYKTNTELQAGNSRFRSNSQIPFIAITYSPKHN